MRRFLLKFGLVCAAVFLLISTTHAQENFSDVPETHPHALAIANLKDAGLVSGYGDKTFKPDQAVSRAEAVAIILKAAGITSEKTQAKLPFNDVTGTAWYFPMLQKGVSMGILKGYGDQTFRPQNPVTMPEALALTLSFYKVSVKNVEVDAVIYGTLASDQWYSPFAQYAKNKNLIEPDSEGNIDPTASLSRGQVAEIIYRMRTTHNTGKSFDITRDWISTEHSENFWRLRHPADWEVFKGQKNSVVWKRAQGQVFFTRVWPQGAQVSISHVDNPNGTSAATYFADARDLYKKKYAGVKIQFSEMLVSGRSALLIEAADKAITDMIVALPDNSFLVMYGSYGDSPLGEFLKKQLKSVMMSYEFVQKAPLPVVPAPLPLEQRMTTLRENILVEGGWKNIATLFADKKLISTDAIGIGTGPVDYYFSKEANQTIKLERNSGTVLNIKEGETSAF